mgnify:CR=1 FL=1
MSVRAPAGAAHVHLSEAAYRRSRIISVRVAVFRLGRRVYASVRKSGADHAVASAVVSDTDGGVDEIGISQVSAGTYHGQRGR